MYVCGHLVSVESWNIVIGFREVRRPQARLFPASAGVPARPAAAAADASASLLRRLRYDWFIYDIFREVCIITFRCPIPKTEIRLQLSQSTYLLRSESFQVGWISLATFKT